MREKNTHTHSLTNLHSKKKKTPSALDLVAKLFALYKTKMINHMRIITNLQIFKEIFIFVILVIY